MYILILNDMRFSKSETVIPTTLIGRKIERMRT